MLLHCFDNQSVAKVFGFRFAVTGKSDTFSCCLLSQWSDYRSEVLVMERKSCMVWMLCKCINRNARGVHSGYYKRQ